MNFTRTTENAQNNSHNILTEAQSELSDPLTCYALWSSMNISSYVYTDMNERDF